MPQNLDRQVSDPAVGGDRRRRGACIDREVSARPIRTLTLANRWKRRDAKPGS